jgi:hypothetical protein
MNEIVLMPDPRVAAMPVADRGEPAASLYPTVARTLILVGGRQ